MKPTQPKRRVLSELTAKEVSSLVLCKGEIFYQQANGGTLKTEYPVSEQAARERANQLHVELLVE